MRTTIATGPNLSPDALSLAILDSAAEGIWGVDLEGRCIFINRAACALLGFRADELIGRNMHEMVHHHRPDGRRYPGTECTVYNVFRESQPFSNQIDHLFRKDGSIFWSEMSAQPILRDGETLGAVVTFRDITQSRQSEETLRRTEKLAAVGQLASSIAHEINNPLEAVGNLLYLIHHSKSLEDAQQFAALAEAEHARVAYITTQTLRFHRQQHAAQLASISETLDSTLRLYSSRLTARRIQVEKRFRDTPPAMIFEGDIRQVINNLVRNSFDAMPASGRLLLRLRQATKPDGHEAGVRITVADTGVGFLPEMRRSIFVPFSTSKEMTGTGLGLWVSRGIIDKHRGSIRMRSRQALGPEDTRHGTVFSIWLPLATPAEA